MDWTDDELESLGEIDVHYSGIVSNYDEIEPTSFNQKYTFEEPDICSENYTKYSAPNSCSTSWATTIIQMVNELYKDTGIRFSLDQLLQCLPARYGFDNCVGVHPKDIVTYLLEFGLLTEKDFA